VGKRETKRQRHTTLNGMSLSNPSPIPERTGGRIGRKPITARGSGGHQENKAL